MLHLISPAKTFDLTRPFTSPTSTLPAFLPQTQTLIERCQQLSAQDLMQLMKISPALANLNQQRFSDWQKVTTSENSKPALFSFNGDVYVGLDAYSLSQDDLLFSQQHLRILSGLYGLLKPLDFIQAYRLEMGTKLANAKGSNLYQFWQQTLTNALNTELLSHSHRAVINLASDEYFSAIDDKKVAADIIKVVFLDKKNGVYKVISFHAKKARGVMSRFIIQQKIDQAEDIKAFNHDGYAFDCHESTAQCYVFKRDAH